MRVVDTPVIVSEPELVWKVKASLVVALLPWPIAVFAGLEPPPKVVTAWGVYGPVVVPVA